VGPKGGPLTEFIMETGMHINTQPLHINARHLKVPCVFYSAGVKFLRFWYASKNIRPDLILRMSETGLECTRKAS
jgi:hypothetical protein